MDPAGTAQAVTHVAAVNPHVQTAVWAIVLAIACALVLIVAEMVKERKTATALGKRNDPADPDA
jgi:uncharacterized membrane protein